jgi:uncharacterized protein (DUF433 family)
LPAAPSRSSPFALYDFQDKGFVAMSAANGRIILDSNILCGKPIVAGTRLSVEFIIGLLAAGWTAVEILANYGQLTHEDIIACLAYAHELLSGESVFPSAA